MVRRTAPCHIQRVRTEAAAANPRSAPVSPIILANTWPQERGSSLERLQDNISGHGRPATRLYLALHCFDGTRDACIPDDPAAVGPMTPIGGSPQNSAQKLS